ncbi:hypothetical protein Q8G41_28910, partial [Klebsiella pneumoniae]|uniref:hypothetical protein n=1 Tax=Klebsiella pneumoniae TaxID=573 RepID=UPI0030376EAD
FGVPAPQRRLAPIPEPEILRDMPVLIVDDNATNLRILHDTLLRWKMRCVLADSGEKALAVMRRRAEAGDRFALVLLDA